MNWLSHQYNRHQDDQCKAYCEKFGLRFYPVPLVCTVQELVEGFDHELLQVPKFKSTGRSRCRILDWIPIATDGSYLLCCASQNVKIGYTIDDDVSEEDLVKAKMKTELCQVCRKNEYWRMWSWITIISQWYNDSLLAPFFLKHYAYADEIHILMETDTNDNSREIASKYPNVVIEDVHCPGGHDDRCKVDNTNKAASRIKEGWIVPVDSDEFSFPEFHEDPHEFLSRQKADVVMATYFYVYRHETEVELDIGKEVISQRVHGRDIDHIWYRYSKVGAYRASSEVELGIGYHTFVGDHSVSEERFIGAHWNMADVEIARRRLVSRDRMSPNNKRHGYGWHNFHITEERIIKQIAKNADLPVLESLVAKVPIRRKANA